MRVARFLVAALSIAVPALAHPPVSVVIDRSGNVFYSDLAQVWRVAPDGTKSVAVPDVHTHELALDAAGNLYGERAEYSGEATNLYHFSIWRRAPDGRLTTVVPRTKGFLHDYGFAWDGRGNMYWADRDRSEIRKRDASGRVTTLARVPLRNVRWLAASKDGAVYFTDTTSLVRVTAQGATTIARNIAGAQRFDVGLHRIMGLWFDPRGNVCFADFGAAEAKCLTREGRIGVVARAEGQWSIAGGAYAPNGDLWLLEWSRDNRARVRRVSGVRRP